ARGATMSDPPALRRRALLPRANVLAALACAPLASHAEAPPPAAVAADSADPLGAATPTRSLGVVSVTGARPTSLPSQIPTTTESVTREQIERTVNATDAEDALKYLPSLLVRK